MAALAVFAAIGTGWPLIAWMISNHDTYVTLQNTVASDDKQIGWLWNYVNGINAKLPPTKPRADGKD
jgi:hypothetical protein